MIITDEKILRICSKPAQLDEIGLIVELLERELANSERLGRPGIGLAAPQLGIHKQVAIIRINDHFKVDLVNCSIEKSYDPIIFKNEGCLSVPGKINDTKRFQEIYVSNNMVQPYGFIATGLMAVAIQHELDHLNGVLFMDRMADQPKKIKARPNESCICGSGKKFKKCCGIK